MRWAVVLFLTACAGFQRVPLKARCAPKLTRAFPAARQQRIEAAMLDVNAIAVAARE